MMLHNTTYGYMQIVVFVYPFFFQRVYQFFKTAVEKSPNVDIEPSILENISGRIPDHLKNGANQQAVLADLLAEVQEEYKTVIRAYTGLLPASCVLTCVTS